MRIDGISFNASWASSKTEREFVEQHLHAFNSSTHPVAKMGRKDRVRFLKNAYAVITGKQQTDGNDQQPDTEV